MSRSPTCQRGQCARGLSSFGSTVVASLAKATVSGEVQIDYAPSGLMWRLTCPAANGLEAGEETKILGKGTIELTARLAESTRQQLEARSGPACAEEGGE